ncbi:MAG: hypothetical protein ABIP48_12385 [Planctomycetota bacterium]
MKRVVAADLASRFLNLISGGVVGDALGRKRAPEKLARAALSGARQRRPVRVRGVSTRGPAIHGNPRQALRESLYGSLARHSRLRLGRILREMLTGAAGGLLVAAVLFPTLYGLCYLLCRWLGDTRWVEPSVLAIALGWFALIFLLHRTLHNRRIDLASNGLRLGRLRSLADPRSAQTLTFFLLTTVGTHAALLYLTPDFFFAQPADLSTPQPLLAAVDNVCQGSLADHAGADTGFAEAEALLSPYGRVLFLAYRSLSWGLLGAFLLWGRYHFVWMRRLYRDFPHEDPGPEDFEKSGLKSWIRYLSDEHLLSFPNEILFLVLASKYIGGDTEGASQMIRDSGDMEVSVGVQELLINEKTGENLFQEAAAAPGADAQCHP